MYVLSIVVCPFVLFLLAIMFSVRLRLRFLITPFLSSNFSQSRHFKFATARTMNECSIIFVCVCWYSDRSMTYWLFEIVLINLCNKYYLFKLKYVWCICVYSNRSIRIMLEYFCYRFLSCICSVWAVKKHWLVKCLLSTVTDQDIVFLVPDSCWAMIINGNSTRADFTEDTVKTIRTTLVSALFRQFNSCFVCFLTLLN
jgi:hypothetical protein